MMSVRARLIVYAIAALVCQSAALSAAPIALCRGALSAAADLDECCRNLKPGQTCPMHHKAHAAAGARGPAWTCVCSPSEAVLASLVGVAGALPPPVLSASEPGQIGSVAVLFVPLRSRFEPPAPPPPRAYRSTRVHRNQVS